MIKEWSLKLNEDQKSYTLTVEDDTYKWVLPNVNAVFDANGFPMCGTIRALPAESTSNYFTITIPDERRLNNANGN